LTANSEPNPTVAQVRRENLNLRTARNVAWITFDQYGLDTGELDTDMPGISRETRILEKHNGEWKIAYVGWLLVGGDADQDRAWLLPDSPCSGKIRLGERIGFS
jgi:hypothetical protein